MYFTTTSIHKIDKQDAIAKLTALFENMTDAHAMIIKAEPNKSIKRACFDGLDIVSLLQRFQDKVVEMVLDNVNDDIWKPWLTKRICNIMDSYSPMRNIVKEVLDHKDGLNERRVQEYYKFVVQYRANLSFLLSDIELDHINADDTWGGKDACLTDLDYGVSIYDTLNQKLYESYPDLFDVDIAPFVDFNRLHQSMRYNLKTQQATYYVKDVYDSEQVYMIEF